DLARGRRAEARAGLRPVGDRLHHARMRVAEEQRTPRAEEIDVGAPVGVDHLRTATALDEDGISAHRLPCTHGAVDAAGDHLARFGEQLLRDLSHAARASHRLCRASSDTELLQVARQFAYTTTLRSLPDNESPGSTRHPSRTGVPLL